jgi:hypothetical protein
LGISDIAKKIIHMFATIRLLVVSGACSYAILWMRHSELLKSMFGNLPNLLQ